VRKVTSLFRNLIVATWLEICVLVIQSFQRFIILPLITPRLASYCIASGVDCDSVLLPVSSVRIFLMHALFPDAIYRDVVHAANSLKDLVRSNHGISPYEFFVLHSRYKGNASILQTLEVAEFGCMLRAHGLRTDITCALHVLFCSKSCRNTSILRPSADCIDQVQNGVHCDSYSIDRTVEGSGKKLNCWEISSRPSSLSLRILNLRFHDAMLWCPMPEISSARIPALMRLPMHN
jgi:hypothetical protein